MTSNSSEHLRVVLCEAKLKVTVINMERFEDRNIRYIPIGTDTTLITAFSQLVCGQLNVHAYLSSQFPDQGHCSTVEDFMQAALKIDEILLAELAINYAQSEIVLMYNFQILTTSSTLLKQEDLEELKRYLSLAERFDDDDAKYLTSLVADIQRHLSLGQYTFGLICGPTRCGKTLSAYILAKYFKLFHIVLEDFSSRLVQEIYKQSSWISGTLLKLLQTDYSSLKDELESSNSTTTIHGHLTKPFQTIGFMSQLIYLHANREEWNSLRMQEKVLKFAPLSVIQFHKACLSPEQTRNVVIVLDEFGKDTHFPWNLQILLRNILRVLQFTVIVMGTDTSAHNAIESSRGSFLTDRAGNHVWAILCGEIPPFKIDRHIEDLEDPSVELRIRAYVDAKLSDRIEPQRVTIHSEVKSTVLDYNSFLSRWASIRHFHKDLEPLVNYILTKPSKRAYFYGHFLRALNLLLTDDESYTPLKLFELALDKVRDITVVGFRRKSEDVRWCVGQVMMSLGIFHSGNLTLPDTFINKHLAYLEKFEGSSTYSLYLDSSRVTPSLILEYWKLSSYYPSLKDDELTFLLFLGRRKSAFFQQVCGVLLYFTAYRVVLEYIRFGRNIPKDNRIKLKHNYGYNLETLVFLASMNASHRNGLSGIELSEFINQFIVECFYDQERLTLVESDELKAYGVRIPFIAPEGEYFSRALQSIPGVFAGTLSFVKDAESVDLLLAYNYSYPTYANVVFECKYLYEPLKRGVIIDCFKNMWNRLNNSFHRPEEVLPITPRSRNVLILVTNEISEHNGLIFKRAFEGKDVGSVVAFLAASRALGRIELEKIYEKSSTGDRVTICIVIPLTSLGSNCCNGMRLTKSEEDTVAVDVHHSKRIASALTSTGKRAKDQTGCNCKLTNCNGRCRCVRKGQACSERCKCFGACENN